MFVTKWNILQIITNYGNNKSVIKKKFENHEGFLSGTVTEENIRFIL